MMRLKNIPGSTGELIKSPFVVQEVQKHKGTWSELFPGKNPIHMEIGMGKGKFLIENAELHPGINYIGIEKYSSVMLRCVQKLEKEPLSNIKLICQDLRELNGCFAENEIERIYLNFSDPWPKARHHKRRLTSRTQLAIYDTFLKHGAPLEFKTDNESLFDFSLEEFGACGWKLIWMTRDLHGGVQHSENVMTEYEERFVAEGKPIYKLIAVHNQ